MTGSNSLNFKVPDKVFDIEIDILKIFILPALLSLFFLISLKSIFVPRITDIRSINAKTNNVIRQTKEAEEKRSYLMSIDKSELIKNADNLDDSLLKEKNSYVLVGMVRKIADKHGFQIKSFSVSPGKINKEEKNKKDNTDVVSKMPVEVSVVGPKDKYLDLLLSLESSLPIMVIDQFEMRSSLDSTEIDMVVSSYYVQEKEIKNLASLSLSDLTLKKEESEVLNKVNLFDNLQAREKDMDTRTGKEFTKYTRNNPFSL